MKLIRDPVHGYVTLSRGECTLVDTPLLQRLRHIVQNGPGRLVYPSLLGTRFEHTIGVMHVAGRILDSALAENEEPPRSPIRDEFLQAAGYDLRIAGLETDVGNTQATAAELRRVLRVAALFHDCGHLPLSHTLEKAFASVWTELRSPWQAALKHHELLGVELVRQTQLPISRQLKRAALLVLLASGEIANSVHWPRGMNGQEVTLARSTFGTLRDILVGEYDADRADYLLRDGYMSGTGFGDFDIERLVDSMRLCKRKELVPGKPAFEILPTVKALSTIESCLIERYKLYKWIHHHHKVCLFDELICRAGKSIFGKHMDSLLSRGYKLDGHTERLESALVDPQSELPPLMLLNTKKGKTGWRTLNPKFFFPGHGSFLDDMWFCQKLRETKWKNELRFLVDAVVYRKPVAVSLWKESQQFEGFLAALPSVCPQPIDVRGHPISGTSLQEFLRRPWNLLAAQVAVEKWRPAFVETLETELSAVGGEGVHPVVRCDDWFWIGRLSKLEVQGRSGSDDIQYLTECSPILKKLSGLPDNIPFHVFFIGDEGQIVPLREKMKDSKEGLPELRKQVCEALMRAIIRLLKNDIEPVSQPLKEALLVVSRGNLMHGESYAEAEVLRRLL